MTNELKKNAVIRPGNAYAWPLLIYTSFLLVFGTTFTPLHAMMENGAYILSGAYPIIAGWLLGMRMGLLYWLFHSLLLSFLARSVDSSVDDLISSGIPQYAITFLITLGAGKIRDLTNALKHELGERQRVESELQDYRETLEQQVAERTEDLTQTNEKLKHEMLQNEKANREKLNLQTSLKRAEKMEAVGILAGSVAHDLNNILSGILSYPELILLDIPADSPLRGPLLTIQDSGQRAAAVVQDLLTLVRKGIINSKAIRLNRIITGFLNSPECRKMKEDYPGTTIETDLQPDLKPLCGSPVHLSKAVMNLVLNAMEAMPKGGRLTIATKNISTGKPADAYEAIPKGDYVAVEISDGGDGIAKKDLDRIFEPFYTKKALGRSGTGLGLAIVWGVVKDHGGYVDVRSREGGGTIFTLYFPAADRAVLPEALTPMETDYTGNGESILIIDDDELQRNVCTGILTKLGYAVHSVAGGEAAVEYLADNSADLLILDMIMPGGLNGFETYKRILEIHPGQKAIIVSGFTESEDVKRTQAMGAGAYIKKPYTLAILGTAVKNELHGSADAPPACRH